VGDAVNQLDQVTQQNAALVEESAAAAESLNQQAARLVSAVSVFDLGTGGHAGAADHRAPGIKAASGARGDGDETSGGKPHASRYRNGQDGAVDIVLSLVRR
jgi:methyl-accepting chemotaxis protein